MKSVAQRSLTIATVLLTLSACTTTDFLSSTSSTLDAATPDVTLNNFVNTRIASIKQESAVGHGENLDALAQLMQTSDKDNFQRMMHENYDALFNQLDDPSLLITRLNDLKTRI